MFLRKNKKNSRLEGGYLLDFVTDNIAIGNSQEASDIDVLKDNGITAVLNVAIDLDIIYQQKRNGEFVIEYHKIGLIDGPGNKDTTMLAAVYMLEQLLENHDRVLVNCHGGISRSVAVVASYMLHTKQCKSFDHAVDIIKVKHSEAKPHKALKSNSDIITYGVSIR